jgi:hypothetical protein
MEIVAKGRDCQFFQKQTTKHANPLRPIDISWPFAIWGIDIVGILPRAPGGFRFLFVGVDTFTKWMEATPVVNITQEVSVKFLQSIIYRFVVPKRVLTDNGTQFKGAKFSKCCADFGIDHQPSSATHPQTNEQVCDRTTSEMRGLSPKIISGDSRRSENAQTHTNKHTIPNMKFKLKLLQIKCHVLGFTKDKAQNVFQKISRVFAEAFISHDRHTLFALEESEPPQMTYTCESK